MIKDALNKIIMKKIPITDIISSWLKADERLEEQCKEEICEYDSNSAYKGYMLGFEDGVNSQIVEEGVEVDAVITKQEIADAFKTFYGKKCAVSEEDCMKYISSSEQYWFFAGALWLIEAVNEKKK